MKRRRFLYFGLLMLPALQGCRGHQYGHILSSDDENLVGSHSAGAEVFDPLVEESVAKLLSRQQMAGSDAMLGADGLPCRKSICFVGIENKSAEELGDFKDQIYQQIDTQIVQSESFQPMSRRVIDAALQGTRLRPDSLLVPNNMALFSAVLQRQGQPIDYLLYGTLTSGTTERNSSSQRDYLLTLELVHIQTGNYDKQSAEIRKGYHRSPMGKWWQYNPLKS